MAEIFKNGTVRQNDCLVSFLVIGPAELCQRVYQGLHQSARARRWHINIHQCECIIDAIGGKINLSVDFIIFAIDIRTSYILSQVEADISAIDEQYFVSGAVCLVNCSGVSNVALIHKSKKLCEKYNICFLSANTANPYVNVQLGNRILNITEGLLGLSSGIPVFRTAVQHN